MTGAWERGLLTVGLPLEAEEFQGTVHQLPPKLAAGGTETPPQTLLPQPWQAI